MNARGEVQTALTTFAEEVRERFQAAAKGEPEDQLRGPFETLLRTAGAATGYAVIPKGETLLANQQGKPDYAVVVDDALTGYVEMKAPGAGVIPTRFKGVHDRSQWKRFKSLPNLLYCDGNGFSLYRDGKRIGGVVELDGEITTDGGTAVTKVAARGLHQLLLQFFAWTPIVPTTPKQLAEVLAPLCRLLRDTTAEIVGVEGSALAQLKEDWQALLFPEADDEQFADAYAQTVTYSLLLARAEGATDLDSATASATLQAGDHLLLARALQVLTDPTVRVELGSLLELFERTISGVEPQTLMKGGAKDPWLYFYETFLAAYDPALRKDAGVYYTPAEVVEAQVVLVSELLRTHLGKAQGFADQDVLTLDPAAGTGTYLLGIIQHALEEVTKAQGPGARAGKATVLAHSLHGFELMVGPYAVAQLRVTRELKANSATLPTEGPKIYLTDTLEHPTTEPKQPPLYFQPIALEHARAQQVKDATPILVCLGNPPYDRHGKSAEKGGWIRAGAQGEPPPLNDFTDPAEEAGAGKHLKNLYNLYVYFWRWAIWKVFEHDPRGPGIISFISGASYLVGPAFVGMREKMRRECDEIWVIDLGGEGRGPRREQNVFAIQTPVAIAIAVRRGEPDASQPATVHYTRIRGTRKEKLATLAGVSALQDLPWKACPGGWQDPFRPAGVGAFFDWPLLSNLFPWQHSGVQVKRLWPIGPDAETVRRRWEALFSSADAGSDFRETGDRRLDTDVNRRRSWIKSGPPLKQVLKEAQEEGSGVPAPADLVPYSYRSFDRQILLADYRVIDRPRPPLWGVATDDQVYLTSLLTHPLGRGPAITVASSPPDLHHFRGSFGGKDAIPLWRDPAATEPNLHPELLDRLEAEYGTRPTPEQVAAYAATVLAQSGYTELFDAELETPEGPRLPVTTDPQLFEEAAALGRRLVWLATFAERFTDDSRPKGKVPQGRVRATHPVSQGAERYPAKFSWDEETKELTVGDGKFSPVSREVWEYEVSGLRVVDSWLGGRMRVRSGRVSSPLDAIQPESWGYKFTEQLLELIWVLEALVELEPQQRDLLGRIVAGPLLAASDLSTLGDDHPARLAPDPETPASLL